MTFYISTPIYYPNAEPHLGHVYTTICADAIARYHRLAGDDTFFLTGTDEHGVKMVKTAIEQGIAPNELADRIVAVFQDLWKELDISNDDFIRTTSDRHKSTVQNIVRKLVANGDIYLGSYEGWYDEGQEEFVTETEAKERNYLAFNRKPLVRYKEPTYYFRLTRYAPKILAHIHANPGFIQPESRRNEVVSKLNGRIEDLSVSRATLKWGIPMPNDSSHVLYVWIDALSNYITGLNYSLADDSRFKKYWPANVHLIGKEIMWFHTVYWPAVLMGIGVELPRRVYAHGWWTAEGRKMSKTEGNFINLERAAQGHLNPWPGCTALLPAPRRPLRLRPRLERSRLQQILQRAGQCPGQLPQPYPADDRPISRRRSAGRLRRAGGHRQGAHRAHAEDRLRSAGRL